jgi:hypothetical protein
MSALASSMRVEDAVLISHKLVGNAIDHARTQCRVTVRLAASTVRIFVSDHSSAVPVLRTRAGTPCVGAASASLLVRLAAGAGTTIVGARRCRHRRTAHPPDPHHPAARQPMGVQHSGNHHRDVLSDAQDQKNDRAQCCVSRVVSPRTAGSDGGQGAEYGTVTIDVS